MSECTFYLNSPNAASDIGYIYASCYCIDGRAQVPIGKSATKKAWKAGDLPKDVASRLRRVKYVVDQYIAQCDLASKRVKKADLELMIKAELTNRKLPGSKSSARFIDEFTRYAGMIESGEIKHNGKIYADATVKQLKGILSHLKELKTIAHKPIDGLTETDVKKLQSAFIGEGVSQNTASVYTTQVRTFLKTTESLGWHANKLGDAKGMRIPWEEIDTKVYCTTERISEIWEKEIDDKELQQIRDAFVFGCQVGQRLSDLRRLQPNSRTGNKLFIGTKKKGNMVVIPMNSLAIEIWDKYGGNIPYTGRFYDSIKTLFKRLGYTEMRLYSYTHGGKKTAEYYPFYELVGSHTMRRSFATNAFLAGIPPRNIMPITGHKTVISFMKYICIDVEENANLMQDHPFFK